MNSRLTAILSASAIGLLLVSPVSAQPAKGKMKLALTGGVDFSVDGDVHGGTNAFVPDLGALNPSLGGVSATLAIESRDFDEIYGETAGGGLEVSYGMSDVLELFGSFTYARANGDVVQVGNAIVPALSASLPVFGDFSNYETHTLEAGARYYFDFGSALKPYVAGRVGVQFVDGIEATFTIPDANITIANARFYDSSQVFIGGVDVGLSYAVNETFTAAVETGFRYSASLNDDDTDIGGLGLASINDEGNRISIPVRGRISAAF